MRTAALALLAGFLLSLFPSVGATHGGGLDAYGCHHNRKAGGYHCHRGPLAGQSFASKDAMLKALAKKDTGEAKTPRK